MSTEKVELVFQGPGVENGTINAALLAESLAGYTRTFNRANELLNGEQSESGVFVQSSFRKGSFIVDLQLVQTLLDHGRQLISAHPVDATGISAALGFGWHYKDQLLDGVLDLYKWLKGKKPDAVNRVGESVEITFGENKKVVTNQVFNLYGDEAIRQGLSKFAVPLADRALDRISISQGGVERASLEKAEVEYFAPEAVGVAPDPPPLNGERQAALTVSKLSFIESSNWTFFEQGSTVVAKIEDPEFWNKVHDRTVTFGEGDTLVVDLIWRIEQKARLVQRNTIRKVLRVIPRPQQLTLQSQTPRKASRHFRDE